MNAESSPFRQNGNFASFRREIDGVGRSATAVRVYTRDITTRQSARLTRVSPRPWDRQPEAPIIRGPETRDAEFEATRSSSSDPDGRREPLGEGPGPDAAQADT